MHAELKWAGARNIWAAELSQNVVDCCSCQIRKSVRHYFLGSRGLKLGYDVLTWAATQLTICYTVMPFLLLSVEPTFIYYR